MTYLDHVDTNTIEDDLVEQYGGEPADWGDLARLILRHAYEIAGEDPGGELVEGAAWAYRMLAVYSQRQPAKS